MAESGKRRHVASPTIAWEITGSGIVGKDKRADHRRKLKEEDLLGHGISLTFTQLAQNSMEGTL